MKSAQMQTRTFPAANVRILLLATLLAIAATAPLAKQQLITGIIVNAVLFLGVLTLGESNGLLLGILPSSIALATGLLPPVLAPMIPFVITGNAILVITFSRLRPRSFWVAAIAACILKFAFLAATSTIVVGLLLNKQIAPSVTAMMTWPQLFTALGGALVAYGVMQLTSRRAIR